MDEPDHALVVMAYGASPFLEGCLESLSKQTIRGRQLITTSTPNDHIAQAARRFGLSVRVNPEARGIGHDWNFALTSTDARLVTLVHQDDTYAPDFCRRSLDALTGSGAPLCFTGYQQIDDDGTPISSKISRVKHLIELLTLGDAHEVRGARLRAYLSFGNPLPCSSVTFDRGQLPDFRFDPTFRSNLDWDAWWRLMKSGATFCRVPERLVGRRHNELTATSRLLRDGARASEDRAMFRRLWPRPLSDLIAIAYRSGY